MSIEELKAELTKDGINEYNSMHFEDYIDVTGIAQ